MIAVSYLMRIPWHRIASSIALLFAWLSPHEQPYAAATPFTATAAPSTTQNLSQQGHGSTLFFAHCGGCHGIAGLRYEDILALGIPQETLKDAADNQALSASILPTAPSGQQAQKQAQNTLAAWVAEFGFQHPIHPPTHPQNAKISVSVPPDLGDLLLTQDQSIQKMWRHETQNQPKPMALQAFFRWASHKLKAASQSQARQEIFLTTPRPRSSPQKSHIPMACSLGFGMLGLAVLAWHLRLRRQSTHLSSPLYVQAHCRTESATLAQGDVVDLNSESMFLRPKESFEEGLHNVHLGTRVHVRMAATLGGPAFSVAGTIKWRGHSPVYRCTGLKICFEQPQTRLFRLLSATGRNRSPKKRTPQKKHQASPFSTGPMACHDFGPNPLP